MQKQRVELMLYVRTSSIKQMTLPAWDLPVSKENRTVVGSNLALNVTDQRFKLFFELSANPGTCYNGGKIE